MVKRNDVAIPYEDVITRSETTWQSYLGVIASAAWQSNKKDEVLF